MKLIGSMLIASLALGVSATALSAADYYIMPARPGPVSGTVLSAISLQGTKTDTRLKLNVNQRGNSAGKWVSVGETSTTETATTTISAEGTTATTSGEGATATTNADSPTTTTGTSGTTTTTTTTAPTTTVTAPAPPPTSGPTYPSIAALVQAGVLQGGDRIFLTDGYHGVINLDGLKFTSAVTVAPVPGQTAQVEMIGVRNSSNITFRDLKVWALSPNAGSGPLIRTYVSASDIAFYNMDVRSVPDATSYLSWDLTAWREQTVRFLLQGARTSRSATG